MSNSKLKIFILAGSLKEYDECIARCLEEDSSFLDHSISWLTKFDSDYINRFEHVQIINGRKLDNELVEAGHYIDFI